MDAPYSRNKYRKKNINQIVQQLKLIQQKKKLKKNKNNKKNDLKGGSISKNNHQEDNTKFNTIARKMQDKV